MNSAGHMLKVVVCVAVASVLGCRQSDFRFDSQELNDNSAKIRSVSEEAELVFVGTVVDMDAAPAYWSGPVAVFQGVTYRVDSVLKGFYDDPTVDILHPVVELSRTAASTPGLSPGLFRQGAKLIVFASPANDFDLRSVDEDFGVIPHSARNERATLFSM